MSEAFLRWPRAGDTPRVDDLERRVLSRLEMENFRAFPRLTLEGLTRVNLLVGRNGGGKTSVLEAVHILAGMGSPHSVLQVVMQRGGYWIKLEDSTRDEWSIHHLFHGAEPGQDTRLKIQGVEGGEPVKVELALERIPDAIIQAKILRGQALLWRPAADSPPVATERRVLTLGGDSGQPLVALELNRRQRLTNGQLLDEEADNRPGLASGLVPCSGISEETLGSWFAEMSLTDAEDRVVEILRILRPDLKRLVWIPESETTSAGFYATLQGRKERQPLDLFGEGVRRLLGIGIRLAQDGLGILLIDEIDTGLHHTVLEQLWRALIELSRLLDVQIFATTHSGDCIRSLAWLIEDQPSFGPDVSLHRIEPGLETSVRYGAEEIAMAARHHVEVRG